MTPPVSKKKTDALAEKERITRNVMSSCTSAAILVHAFVKAPDTEFDINTMVQVLNDCCESIEANNLSQAEFMLISQAHALQSIFLSMGVKAAANTGSHLAATEVYMRMALKAQAQCRATLETLAEIKNPRAVAFVKQANISHGHQQVNNRLPAGELPSHENSSIQTNELLEAQHGNFLDTRTTSEAISRGSSMETVGEEHRAEDAGR